MINTIDEAREFTLTWQYNFDMHNYSYEDLDEYFDWRGFYYSYEELVEWQGFFEDLAKRFPELRDELKENGICS